MISVDRLVDIICAETESETPKDKPDNPIDYRLELIRHPDGTYEWVED